MLKDNILQNYLGKFLNFQDRGWNNALPLETEAYSRPNHQTHAQGK